MTGRAGTTVRRLAPALALVAAQIAHAQPAPAQLGPLPGVVAQAQAGIGPTGSMYDGNNRLRFPLAPPPSPNPAGPATPGVTGTQGPHDESGAGAGGGEH